MNAVAEKPHIISAIMQASYLLAKIIIDLKKKHQPSLFYVVFVKLPNGVE